MNNPSYNNLLLPNVGVTYVTPSCNALLSIFHMHFSWPINCSLLLLPRRLTTSGTCCRSLAISSSPLATIFLVNHWSKCSAYPRQLLPSLCPTTAKKSSDGHTQHAHNQKLVCLDPGLLGLGCLNPRRLLRSFFSFSSCSHFRQKMKTFLTS